MCESLQMVPHALEKPWKCLTTSGKAVDSENIQKVTLAPEMVLVTILVATESIRRFCSGGY